MEYQNKWEIVREIGEGGQGKVYQVLNKTVKKETDYKIADFLNSIKVAHINDIQNRLDEFFNQAHKRLSLQDSSFHKALKILHKPIEARDSELAKERIKIELKAMHDIQHSNLIKIIEYNSNENWFVSEYYSNGTLDKILNLSFGKVMYSLKLIRPLVEAVSELHKNKFVHRDIKPENIFIASNSELILGDFGLIFFNDNKLTRVSNTFSNVGSRDWMPGWAMGKRIEEVNPAFDVFSLGKILWSMISGISILQLWYFRDTENNLESLFPQKREMKIINSLLDKCIVEREKDCIPNANDLLEEIDRTIDKIESKIDFLKINDQRPCKICGNGIYKADSKGNIGDTNNFGLRSIGSRHFLIFTCNNCGHVQLFSYEHDVLPKAWEE